MFQFSDCYRLFIWRVLSADKTGGSNAYASIKIGGQHVDDVESIISINYRGCQYIRGKERTVNRKKKDSRPCNECMLKLDGSGKKKEKLIFCSFRL